MSIINQLEKTVTPAVLGDSSDRDSNGKDSVAYVGLLEQFYAILASRLALPQVYSDLIRNDELLTTDSAVERPLFEQLWQDSAIRQMMIRELADTHHIDTLTTSQLLINATPLAYRELKILSHGQFLPAFLQSEQSALRQYLPIWSAPVIGAPQSPSNGSNVNPNSGLEADATTVPVSVAAVAATQESDIDSDAIATSTASYIESENYLDNVDREHAATDFVANTDAIHANPSAHRWNENSSMKQEKVRTRNQRNDLLVRVFLLVTAIAATALAAWALLVRPNNVPPVQPVAVEPVAVTPSAEPPAQVMTPVELVVGVDNSGSLYTCSATVGDEALQGTLQQALNSSFGEQASICEFRVQTGVANEITAIPSQVLPNIFTMLRSTPFARLQLQNDRLTLEAPDSVLQQRLVMEIQALAPTMSIDSTAPLPLPNNNNVDAANNMAGMNGMNPQFENGSALPNNQYNNYNGGGSGEYQESDDNTGDSVLPVLPSPNNGSFNNNVPANIPSNNPRNAPINNTPNRPSGPISPEEADAMANSVIVVEPQQVR